MGSDFFVIDYMKVIFFKGVVVYSVILRWDIRNYLGNLKIVSCEFLVWRFGVGRFVLGLVVGYIFEMTM